ncbi:6-phosphogluconolactonase [Petrotoga sp. 9PWA.NaAc.5.4]|uniref:6-phosphogluconolactonase n=1 Tax=Petrotoga sp. 9PWA.NaAc.5.4 TaxID=1434328 RepID=UPI000CB2B6AD|nr:6-phosphogluconolactonase [Petrotoga sp. 9PWA.NaAc.5.4]PNR93384.1 6-phosphogluconolactonase [Petrotoga sp. 9PWA.NaAc.5.4]
MYFKIFENSEEFLEESSNFIYKTYKKSIDKNNQFSFMISGGNTPKPLFKKLTLDYKDKINWEKVFIFWADERYVDKESDDNNYKWAYKLLLSRVNIPQNNIYRIKTELPLEKAAEEYEKEIINFFQGREPAFDLILLGVGKDGHTASLFPNSNLLTENKRLVVPVSPSGDPYVPRITVTYKVLNNAKNILFLSSYNDKKNVIDAIITNKEMAKEKYPAAGVEAKKIYFFSYK